MGLNGLYVALHVFFSFCSMPDSLIMMMGRVIHWMLHNGHCCLSFSLSLLISIDICIFILS